MKWKLELSMPANSYSILASAHCFRIRFAQRDNMSGKEDLERGGGNLYYITNPLWLILDKLLLSFVAKNGPHCWR